MGRWYEDPETGERVPSVTTICAQLPKPGIPGWVAKFTAEYAVAHPGASLEEIQGATNTYMKEAQVRGTRVHAALVSGKWARDLAPWKASARRVFEQHQIEPIEQERVVYSRRERYAGTLDAIAYVGGELALVDYKTAPSGVWPETRIQLAGYRFADDVAHYPFRRFCVVRITDTVGELVDVEVGMAEFEVFKRLRANYEWIRSA